MTSEEAYQLAKSESYVRLNHRHASDDTEWNFSPTVQARIEAEIAKLSAERIAYIFRNDAQFAAIQELHPDLTATRLAELGLELLGNPYNGRLTDGIALGQTLADKFNRLYQALSGSTSIIDNFTYYEFGVKLFTEQQHGLYSEYLVSLPTTDLTFANLYTEAKRVQALHDTKLDPTLEIEYSLPLVKNGDEYHAVFHPDGLQEGDVLGVFSLINADLREQDYEVSIIGDSGIIVEPTGNPFEYAIKLGEDANYENKTAYNYELMLKEHRFEATHTKYHQYQLTINDINDVEIGYAVWNANEDKLYLDVVGPSNEAFLNSLTINGEKPTIDTLESDASTFIVDTSAIDMSSNFYVEKGDAYNEINKLDAISYVVGEENYTMYKLVDAVRYNGLKYHLVLEDGANPSNIWFDRNLGANNDCSSDRNDCAGLLYQWGRDTGDGHGVAVNDSATTIHPIIPDTFQPQTDSWYYVNTFSGWTTADLTAQADALVNGEVHYVCPKYFTVPGRDEMTDLARFVKGQGSTQVFPPMKGFLAQNGVLMNQNYSGFWTRTLQDNKPMRMLYRDSVGHSTPVAVDSSMGYYVRCIATFTK